MSVYEVFAKRLKEVRKEKKLTQTDLAKAINVTKNYIAKIEVGISYPRFDNVVKLANYLGFSLQELQDKVK